MSQSGDGLHTPGYLSWRKLQLSRAKLKASSKTSALLSGFAMVQLNSDTKVPSEMLIAFAVCTTLLVAVHMLALMISTCILPNIEAVCNLHSISLVHESPHERLHWYIEVAWAFSTLLGLLLFLLEIAILCWVKFYDFSQVAAWSACIVLIPVLIIFLAFAIHFYRSLVAHKYEVTVSGIRELELLKEQIESTDTEGRNGLNLLQSAVKFEASQRYVPVLIMCDDFNLCECINADELLVQRLLSILRQTQHYCSDNECFGVSRLPGSLPVQPSSNVFMTCLFVAFIFLMYIIRPRSLRQASMQNNAAKTLDDVSGSSNDPPPPPPTGN
ncbi:hypothetical protein KPH14_005691 [Odynerus spinipes]|uniref:Calcium release-activated calcium channel protein 1 n=1 Tax=Odynerus spinipes TaxID=1348599 RepID=A0AAD9RAW6_9HYME|nr:hypothetical protein KPH14_005691 [Odynerus spinipes]